MLNNKQEPEKVNIKEYSFEKSILDPSNIGSVIEKGGLGCGIICYKNGQYIGYLNLSEETLEKPLEEIVKSQEFIEKIKKFGKINL